MGFGGVFIDVRAEGEVVEGRGYAEQMAEVFEGVVEVVENESGDGGGARLGEGFVPSVGVSTTETQGPETCRAAESAPSIGAN